MCSRSLLNPVNFAKTKIAIVGAGIAGLTAAYRLNQAGMYDVVCYEARGRVGGRILSIRIDGNIGELGGQNISDGGDADNLKRLISELGLRWHTSRLMFRQATMVDEQVVSIDELLQQTGFNAQSLRKKLDGLATDCSTMQQVLDRLFDTSDPLHAVFATKLASYEGGEPENLSSLYVDTLYHMMTGGLCSAHPGTEQEAGVDFTCIEGGNSQLLLKLAEALGERLHLNHVLSAVSRNGDGQYALQFLNGKTIFADALILAIPCSIYEKVVFSDDVISESKLSHICGVSYGANAKILIPFEQKRAQVDAMVADHLVTFFDSTQQLLTVYFTGQYSQFSAATIATSYDHAKPLVERTYGHSGLDQPLTCAHDENGRDYAGPVGYSWPVDPFAKGTYSYIGAGQEKLLLETVEQQGQVFRKLFAPIDKRLYFVGEHTSILFDTPGTMEAACESGERIAQAILFDQKR